jgi:hypothetical protein
VAKSVAGRSGAVRAESRGVTANGARTRVRSTVRPMATPIATNPAAATPTLGQIQ